MSAKKVTSEIQNSLIAHSRFYTYVVSKLVALLLLTLTIFNFLMKQIIKFVWKRKLICMWVIFCEMDDMLKKFLRNRSAKGQK